MAFSKTFQEVWLPKNARIENENIELFLRSHVFTLILKLLFVLVLALIPVIVYYFVQYLFPMMLVSNLSYAALTLLGSAYYLFIIVSGYNVFIDYYFDIWIVTSRRVIDMELKGLFNYTISEQGLAQVQDVQAKVKGIFPTFLDYGDVLIQSAGTQNLFHFEQVPDPQSVARKINSLAQQFRSKK